METNLIKNAVINTRMQLRKEQKDKPKVVDNKMGLLSRTKNDTIKNTQPEHDSIRLAKMIKGKFSNA